MAGLRSILRLLWEIICPYEIRWGTEQVGSGTLQESEMTDLINLNRLLLVRDLPSCAGIE